MPCMHATLLGQGPANEFLLFPPTHAAAEPPQWCPQALVGLRALESLDACGNQLKRGGACALAKACARKPGLALLALDENEISEAGLEALRVSGAGLGGPGWAGC